MSKLRFFLLGSLMLSQVAWAAQIGRVTTSIAQVHEQPNIQSKVLEIIKVKAYVTMSNAPVQGYYKVRTATQTIGWVDEKSLILKDPYQEGDKSESSPPPPPDGDTRTPSSLKKKKN